MKKIFFVFLLTGIISATLVKAHESIFSIQYSMGFATGDLKSFNNAASFRGMSFVYRYLMQPAMGVGFETRYNLFYDRMDYATYTRNTIAFGSAISLNTRSSCAVCSRLLFKTRHPV